MPWGQLPHLCCIVVSYWREAVAQHHGYSQSFHTRCWRCQPCCKAVPDDCCTRNGMHAIFTCRTCNCWGLFCHHSSGLLYTCGKLAIIPHSRKRLCCSVAPSHPARRFMQNLVDCQCSRYADIFCMICTCHVGRAVSQIMYFSVIILL